MKDFFDILNFLLISISVGFVSAHAAKALDFALDFGHIFDEIRLRKARKAADKAGKLEYFEKEFEKRKAISTFAERLNEIDSLYWSVANDSPSLTLWLCRVCLSHRITALLSILTSFFYLTANDIHFAAGFVLYIIAFSVNQYFITND